MAGALTKGLVHNLFRNTGNLLPVESARLWRRSRRYVPRWPARRQLAARASIELPAAVAEAFVRICALDLGVMLLLRPKISAPYDAG